MGIALSTYCWGGGQINNLKESEREGCSQERRTELGQLELLSAVTDKTVKGLSSLLVMADLPLLQAG